MGHDQTALTLAEPSSPLTHAVLALITARR
jgi:hypothetical protein